MILWISLYLNRKKGSLCIDNFWANIVIIVIVIINFNIVVIITKILIFHQRQFYIESVYCSD